MDWGAFVFAVAFMAVVVVVAQWRALRTGWRWWKERPERAARARAAEESLGAWRAEYEAANPEGPPITPEEHADFSAWFAAQVRPAMRLSPKPGPAAPDGCRIGGPVWLAEEQEWPLSPRGNRMEFLAQLDFAAMPALPGFPRGGVVQVFLPTDDDLMGMNPDDPVASTVAVLSRPNGAGAVRHENLAAAERDGRVSALSDTASRTGMPLAPEAITMPIMLDQWQIEARLHGHHRREGFEEWEDLLDEIVAPPETHHVGGYPSFVQYDFRAEGRHDDYDTCLLRLTSDKHLQWGDVGEANLLIRAEDLAAGDFSRVIFWWDCS
ncbi:YwqG family protein [Erythrobacter oryzae]|uniref:YwqG family protein n=1 Tax=Erythrobacter oryzae TaxID=3019556 RepID=UPI0025560CDB|nr:DUF1963 domain-containing protein [Erythrobacter sp. COR-2]